VRHSLSSAALTHRRSGRPLGGLLPIIGVIFGLGLAAGAIFRPPLTPPNPQIGLHNRGAITWSGQRYADFNPQVTYPAEVLRVIDGDTFEARLHVWRGFEVNTRVRLRASMRPSCMPGAPRNTSKPKPRGPLCSASCPQAA